MICTYALKQTEVVLFQTLPHPLIKSMVTCERQPPSPRISLAFSVFFAVHSPSSLLLGGNSIWTCYSTTVPKTVRLPSSESKIRSVELAVRPLQGFQLSLAIICDQASKRICMQSHCPEMTSVLCIKDNKIIIFYRSLSKYIHDLDIKLASTDLYSKWLHDDVGSLETFFFIELCLS